MSAAPVLLIEPEGFGFRVRPEPRDPSRPDLESIHSTAKDARRAAHYLGIVKGWKVTERLEVFA